MSVPVYKPCYFLAPTRNNPPEGFIQLGNILQAPDLPDDPLELASPVPVTTPVTTHSEYGWSWNVGKSTSTTASIWASFLEYLAEVGGEASLTWSRNKNMEWTAERITTLEFKPNEDWLNKIVEDTKIRQKLIKWKFWEYSKDIYVVVGIKIAVGASLVTEFAREFGVSLHAGVDLTALGLPADVGAGADHTREQHAGESVDKIDNFVIGYRIRKLKLSRKYEIKENKPHEYGAAFRDGDGKPVEQERIEILADGLEEHDLQGWQCRMKMDEIEGGGYAVVQTGTPAIT
jgi:hypothetical protein